MPSLEMSSQDMSDFSMPAPSWGQKELETQLAMITKALASCFAQAEAPDRTIYGTQRRDEFGFAERLLALSAALGQALARLKGEFHHEISVSRPTGPNGLTSQMSNAAENPADKKLGARKPHKTLNPTPTPLPEK